MKRRTLLAAGTAAAFQAMAQNAPGPFANRFDLDLAGRLREREKDWRIGAVVYQVLVDRFAPSARLESKRALYPAPKRLRDWSELPTSGTYLEHERVWSHEIDFWGGDLASTRARLDHVQSLGADVLYLNPIHLGYTNHKYDALDYKEVSPEFGTRADVRALADDLHRRGMKLVLDGVFNHMGRNAPIFRDALANPASPWRDWFVFDPRFPGGARGWWNVENLPELNLENPAVRAHVYGARDSVVRGYLRDGVDGWRLDVGFDIGFAFLEELTRAAHAEKPGSLVVGEIANYPREWFPSVDGVMHFMLRHLLLRLANGRLDAVTFMRMVQRVIDDTGIENMMRSWIYLDNHDTPRLATLLPDVDRRRIAQVLQFTLPGSPNLYYGSEVAMTGGDDPEQRAPMRWDLVAAGHPELAWTRALVAMRRERRALRIGEFRTVTSRSLLAFERYTDRAADTVLVLANPGDTAVTETIMPANSKLMDGSVFDDLVDAGGAPQVRMFSSLIELTMPPRSVRVLAPRTGASPQGYTNYKRVQ